MADVPGTIVRLRKCPDVIAPAADRQMLEIVIRDLVGIPDAHRRAGNNPLWNAFAEMGVQNFLGDLITLTEQDIMDLQVRPTRAAPHPAPVRIMWKHKTVTIVTAYHHHSRLKGNSIDMRVFPIQLYDHFCISIYRHDETVVPWQSELPSQVNARATFLKSIKPYSKEHKVLQDDKS